MGPQTGNRRKSVCQCNRFHCLLSVSVHTSQYLETGTGLSMRCLTAFRSPATLHNRCRATHSSTPLPGQCIKVCCQVKPRPEVLPIRSLLHRRCPRIKTHFALPIEQGMCLPPDSLCMGCFQQKYSHSPMTIDTHRRLLSY